MSSLDSYEDAQKSQKAWRMEHAHEFDYQGYNVLWRRWEGDKYGTTPLFDGVDREWFSKLRIEI